MAQRVVELQRVEQHRRTLGPDDIGQVQITVHLTHMAGAAAQVHQAGQCGAAGLGPALQRGDGGLVGLGRAVPTLWQQRGQLDQVLAGPMAGGLSPTKTGRRRWLLVMEARHHRRQTVDPRPGQLAALRQPVQSLTVVEAAHLHSPVDHRRALGQRITRRGDACAVGSLAHRHHGLVPTRRGAAVQPQLLLAGLAPCRHGGEIDKAHQHRFFQLVDQAAGQQHRGQMGFDQPRGLGGARAGARPAKFSHHPGVPEQRRPVSLGRGACVRRGSLGHGLNTPAVIVAQRALVKMSNVKPARRHAHPDQPGAAPRPLAADQALRKCPSGKAAPALTSPSEKLVWISLTLGSLNSVSMAQRE